MSGHSFLNGIRVLDLTSVVVGPAATLRLAELGAEIIKIEPPHGDILRTLGGPSPSGTNSGKFLHFNKGKKSVCLDLKRPKAYEVLLRILSSCDVFISNFRPDALLKLKLDAVTLRALDPALIHCVITGYGPGPYRGLPAYDSVLQGAAGVAGLSLLRDGVPRYAPFLLADHLVGEIAAGLVSAALFSRASTHSGTSLEVPMMETLSAFVLKEHLGPSSFHPPLGRAGDVRVLDPENSPLQTSDGFISVTSNSDKQVAGFLRAVGHPELIHEPRFSTVVARFNNARDWFQFRSQTLKTNTTAYWLKAFAAADVPAMPCNTLESLQEDPQIKAAGLLVKKIHPSEGLVTVIQSSILIDGERAEDDSHSPGIGSDTRAVLVGTGMVEEEIDALAADGDIFCSQGANPPKMVAQ